MATATTTTTAASMSTASKTLRIEVTRRATAALETLYTEPATGVPASKRPAGNSIVSAPGKPYLRENLPGVSTVACCAPDQYVSGKIGCYIRQRCLPRRQAILRAYRKAEAQRWHIFEGEAGGCHSIVHRILRAPGELLIALGNALSLTGGAATDLSDNLVVVPFGCPPKCVIPACGGYTIGSKLEGGESASLAAGTYEFPSHIPAGECYDMRVPLYREGKLLKAAERCLPIADMVIKCSRNAIDPERIDLHGCTLRAQLVPDARTLLSPDVLCTPTGSIRNVLEYEHPPCTAFVDEEDCMRSNPHARLQEVHGALEAVMRERISGEKHLYRIVGHIGSTQVCNLGNDSPSAFYRMGGVTEIISTAAFLHHLQTHGPPEMTTFNIHDPSLTERMLELSGASNVLAGLARCYKASGSGRLPTIAQLMHHQSGLPEALYMPIDRIHEVVELSSTATPQGGFDASEVEKRFGAALCETQPLYRPGSNHAFSYLNNAVLRYMLPDWRTGDHRCLRKTCIDFGMPSADLSVACVGRHAGPTADIDEAVAARDSQFFTHSSGLSARTEEVATFLAALPHACKHSWTDVRYGDRGYCFMPKTLVPCAAVARKLGLAFGYGWHHVSLLRHTKTYGAHGLRAMVRVGETPGHTCLVCLVPGVGLSFVLNSTAALANLVGTTARGAAEIIDISTLGLLDSIVGGVLRCMAGIPSVRSKVATFYNPTLNEELAVMPAPSSEFAQHVDYCRNKYALFSAPVPDLEEMTGKEFVSLLEGPSHCRAGIIRETITHTTRKYLGYALILRNHDGAQIGYPIAYDNGAHPNLKEALEAGASRRGKAGCFRLLCRNTGTLGEHIDLALLHVSNGSVAYSEPVLSCRGRYFVTPRLYEIVKRKYAPDEDDLMKERLALSETVDKSIEATAQKLADLALIGMQAASDSTTTAVKAAGAPLSGVPTNTQPSGRFRGRGLGFGAGLALGTLGAAAVTAPYWAYGSPYYYDGYYPPGAVVPPGYWRRPWYNRPVLL